MMISEHQSVPRSCAQIRASPGRVLRSWPVPWSCAQIMACPSGCLNGGGQIKRAEGQTSSQLLDSLEQAYNHKVRIRSRCLCVIYRHGR